ncbi:hypothetical protein ACKUB1_00925 [Methanospirillum stamsii]|uniref:hypothetical protein n=1 Tax=Methanospirillum stamsii TaxID=1277351 RepID=UPI0015E836D2|nr:hypothetical protein [Methanospirillum stamsii]
MSRPFIDDCRIKCCKHLIWVTYQWKKNPNKSGRRRICALANRPPSYLLNCPLEDE